MAIKYEYSSTCCNHFYIETRNEGEEQITLLCNVCGQGEYEVTSETFIESIQAPVYVASVEDESEDLPVE